MYLQILFGFLVLAGHFQAMGNEKLIYFIDPSSPEIKVHLLEFGGKPNKAIFRVEGLNIEENGQTFMFEEVQAGRFASLNGVSNLILMDSDRVTLSDGTIKKTWKLAGMQKSAILIKESPELSKLSSEDLKRLYAEAEGQGSYGEDLGKIQSKAQSLVQSQCGASVTVTAGTFKPSVTLPAYKIVGASRGIARICKDEDYAAALQAFKTVDFKAGESLQIKKAGTKLEIQLPNELENAGGAVHTKLMDVL